ncbi:Pr6Pr family membrane protein [Streptomyces sp. NRRL B-3648]|uniref:Pr6Pr family membrane protein n=1 Tax=Streptomyces sp. NRRL B-3648 TaxID=1519493 RepID=UPI0006AFC5AD|nr:Pr6Pr family membrane protein [Streptomyces sp. NRRL B-3648]KOX05300.1 integral membrane regulator [Streptomyces sp. NRRL B-3648]
MTAPIPREIPELPAIPGPPLLLPAPVPATAVVAPVRRPLAAVFRLVTAAAAALGVALELLLGSPARILSYFSVQTGVLLAVVMFLSARRAWHARRPLPSGVSGAALLYVLTSALVYHLLLGHATPPFSMTGATAAPERWHTQWAVLQILHTLVPTAAVLDWLLLTTAARLHLRQAAAWLLYPLAYLTFFLTRAAFLPPTSPSRYLYPFLDVAAHGYRITLANALLLGLAIYALALLLVGLDQTRPTPVRRRA